MVFSPSSTSTARTTKRFNEVCTRKPLSFAFTKGVLNAVIGLRILPLFGETSTSESAAAASVLAFFYQHQITDAPVTLNESAKARRSTTGMRKLAGKTHNWRRKDREHKRLPRDFCFISSTAESRECRNELNFPPHFAIKILPSNKKKISRAQIGGSQAHRHRGGGP